MLAREAFQTKLFGFSDCPFLSASSEFGDLATQHDTVFQVGAVPIFLHPRSCWLSLLDVDQSNPYSSWIPMSEGSLQGLHLPPWIFSLDILLLARWPRQGFQNTHSRFGESLKKVVSEEIRKYFHTENARKRTLEWPVVIESKVKSVIFFWLRGIPEPAGKQLLGP